MYVNIARNARTPRYFEVENHPEIDFVSQICCSRDFTKIMIFHENHEFSSPRGWPWGRSNFVQWIFWKLSRSESESAWSKLRLDKRKLKSDGWILSNLDFPEIFDYIVPCHDFRKFALLAKSSIALDGCLGYSVSTSHMIRPKFWTLRATQRPHRILRSKTLRKLI